MLFVQTTCAGFTDNTCLNIEVNALIRQMQRELTLYGWLFESVLTMLA